MNTSARTRLSFAGITCALIAGFLHASGGTAAAAVPAQWSLKDDWKSPPNHANPAPDSEGNQGVWNYYYSAVPNQDSGSYSLLNQAGTGSNGIFAWTKDNSSLVHVAKNTGDVIPIPPVGEVPADRVVVFPDASNDVVIGWKSPFTGSVTVAGTLNDRLSDEGNGDGVRWSVEKGATVLRSGTLADTAFVVLNPNASDVPALTNISVQAGEFIYLVVDSGGAGNDNSDLIEVNFAIENTGGGGGGGDNENPTISAVTATPSAIVEGKQSTIAVAASDADGDQLQYRMDLNVDGDFDDKNEGWGTKSSRKTSKDIDDREDAYNLDVEVRDPAGAHDAAKVELTVIKAKKTDFKVPTALPRAITGGFAYTQLSSIVSKVAASKSVKLNLVKVGVKFADIDGQFQNDVIPNGIVGINPAPGSVINASDANRTITVQYYDPTLDPGFVPSKCAYEGSGVSKFRDSLDEQPIANALAILAKAGCNYWVSETTRVAGVNGEVVKNASSQLRRTPTGVQRVWDLKVHKNQGIVDLLVTVTGVPQTLILDNPTEPWADLPTIGVDQTLPTTGTGQPLALNVGVQSMAQGNALGSVEIKAFLNDTDTGVSTTTNLSNGSTVIPGLFLGSPGELLITTRAVDKHNRELTGSITIPVVATNSYHTIDGRYLVRGGDGTFAKQAPPLTADQRLIEMRDAVKQILGPWPQFAAAIAQLSDGTPAGQQLEAVKNQFSIMPQLLSADSTTGLATLVVDSGKVAGAKLVKDTKFKTGQIAAATLPSGGSARVAVSLITDNGAGLIGMDGASLIGMDGSSLISLDGASLIGMDGASFKKFNINAGSLLANIDTATAAALVPKKGAGLLANALIPPATSLVNTGIAFQTPATAAIPWNASIVAAGAGN